MARSMSEIVATVTSGQAPVAQVIHLASAANPVIGPDERSNVVGVPALDDAAIPRNTDTDRARTARAAPQRQPGVGVIT